MAPLIKVTGLHVQYPGAGSCADGVSDVDIAVSARERIGLVGESGAGKTTLLHAVLGLLPYRGGRVTGGTIAIAQGTTIAYVPQDPNTAFDPLFPVGTFFAETLAQGGKIPNPAEPRELIRRALRDVELPEDLNLKSYPHELSGGMKQRLLIAAQLLTEPQVIILDEPTSNLDVITGQAVMALFERIAFERDVSFILATHDLRLARRFCQRIYVMKHGTIVEHNSVKALFEHPEYAYTRALIEAMELRKHV